MSTTAVKLSQAQATTLHTMLANGGEMNGYAGQRGFYCNSIPVLVRRGLVERLDMCEACSNRPAAGVAVTCQRPLAAQKGGGSCYNRVRVTNSGRDAAGIPSVKYNPDTDRYELPDGTEDPGCRARRLVEESSAAAFWGD